MLKSPSGSFEDPGCGTLFRAGFFTEAETAAVAGCDGMIGVEAATGLGRGEFPTELSTVFMTDLFSWTIALTGDEVETFRLLLTDDVEVDDADDEVEEDEFLLRRLVFELPIGPGLLLGRVSASFFLLDSTGAWSESELSSLSWRSQERENWSDTGGPAAPVEVGRLSTGWTALELLVATVTTSLGTKRSLEVSLVSIRATPRMVPCSSRTLYE